MSVQIKGVGTIGGLDEGLVVSGIVTSSTQINVGSNIKIGSAGVVTATSFVGSGANLTSLPAQATITNNANNRVITGGSGVNLNGESNLTFDGTTLYTVGDYMVKDPSTASYVTHTFASNFAKIDFRGTNIANSNHYLIGYGAGHASANDLHLVNTVGDIVLRTTSERLRITSTGKVNIGDTQMSQNILNIEDGTAAALDIASHGSGGDTAYIGVKKSSGGGLTIGISNRDIIFKTGATYSNGTVFDSGTERLRITSAGVIQTGSKTITGGNNLAIQGFAVKGIWSGSPSIGKEIELISGYDSNVKMAAIGYNLTDVNTGSTYGGDLVFHTQPSYSSPTSPVPERMRISSSGYVTKPSQPAFHAYGNNSWTQYTGSNNTVKLLNSNCNVGSHYKTSGSDEGKFVCPVAGNYLFYFTIYSGRTDNSQTDNSNYLSINLISSTGSLANKGGHHIGHYYNEADRDSTRTISYIKTCAVGEKIYISVSCNGAGYQIYGGHSGFGGYLLG